MTRRLPAPQMPAWPRTPHDEDRATMQPLEDTFSTSSSAREQGSARPRPSDQEKGPAPGSERPVPRPTGDRELPPHAPQVGGFLHKVLGRFYFTGSFWFRFHRWGVSVLPEWGLWACTLFFTSVFFLLLGRIRRAVASNLEAVLGPCGWWQRQKRVYATLWNFAWCTTERYEELSTDKRVRTTIEGQEYLDQCLDGDRGLVLVTAHIGHWESGSRTAANKRPRPVHVVREDEMDPQAQQFVSELLRSKAQAGYTVHFSEEPTRLGVLLLAALRRGEVVAVQGDRPRTGTRTHKGRLFGREIELPAGPAVLGRTAQVPLLPVFMLREGRLAARVVVRPPVFVSQTGDRRRDLGQAVERIATEVEAAIRRAPTQWFCFRELWPRS
jgi:KDO2-lipid IV(A) lauroyltransferase